MAKFVNCLIHLEKGGKRTESDRTQKNRTPCAIENIFSDFKGVFFLFVLNEESFFRVHVFSIKFGLTAGS